MNLLDLLATRPVGRFYDHLRPTGTHTKGFDLATGTAEAYLQALRGENLSLQALQRAALELYAWRYPRWRGLGAGFAKAADVPPWDGLFALWVLGVLGSGGWSLLEVFEADPMALLQELLTGWPPHLWLDQTDLLRLPREVRELLKNDRLEVGPVRRVDLRWLPRRMACGLTLRGPIAEAQLPVHLRCRGPIHIDGVGGIEQVQNLEAPDHEVHLTGLPELRRVCLTAGTRLVADGCPELHIVEGEMDRTLVLRNLPRLEMLDVKAPDLAGRAADLTVVNCPRLSKIHWPGGPFRWVRNLTLVDCPGLLAVPKRLRVTGETKGSGCPALVERGKQNEEG